jgi:hypothetical protein
MKKAALLIVMAFVATLAAIIAQRMSTDAMAVVVGVVCGVAASIPTSLLIIFVTGRRERDARANEAARPAYPPIVVVNPGATPQNLNPYAGAYLPPAGLPSGSRQFRLVGDDITILDDLKALWRDEL